jgi:hypothetical protein
MNEKSKDERLAEALRNNLRRRKQQAREVEPEPPEQKLEE